MKRLSVVIPIMIIVAFLAMWFLAKDYGSIPLQTRNLIALGGALLSGIISYFLLQKEADQIDPKPNNDK